MPHEQPLPVTIFFSPRCRYSTRIRERLVKWGIPLQEFNVLEDEAAARRLEGLARGYRSTPTLVFGNEVKVLVEPTLPELKAALREAGYDVPDEAPRSW